LRRCGEVLDQVEREMIEQALARSEDNKSEAAQKLTFTTSLYSALVVRCGVLDHELLESALARPRSGYYRSLSR